MIRKIFASILSFVLLISLVPFEVQAATGTKTIFLTTNPGAGNQTWNVPSDWNSSNNTIECIGSGGTGGVATHGSATGQGGGGGAYSEGINLSLTAGGTATYYRGLGYNHQCIGFCHTS
jgi:hypothetical protein